MQIHLNDRTEEVRTEGLQFFGQLMERVSEMTAKEGGTVLSVKVNGLDVTGRDRSNLEELPIEEIEDIEIQTGDPKTLARSTLYSIADFHEQLLKELRNTAELFRLNNFDRSNSSFIQCIDGLQVFMHTLESCRKLLGISFELLRVPSHNGNESETVAENRRQIFAALDGMIAAQTDQDWILLADLVEYELLPPLEDWRNIIQLILDKTTVSPPRSVKKNMDQPQSVVVG